VNLIDHKVSFTPRLAFHLKLSANQPLVVEHLPHRIIAFKRNQPPTDLKLPPRHQLPAQLRPAVKPTQKGWHQKQRAASHTLIMTPRLLCVSFLLGCQLLALDVSGKVIDSTTGKPVAKCNLVIGTEAQVSLNTLTDAEGNFKFTNLSEGNYLLVAVRKGYLPKAYGSSIPQNPGRLSTLREDTSNILLRMIRTSVIAGRVHDEDGDPVGYATVIVFKEIRRESGRIDYTQAAAGRAESDGTYSISDIPPGEYRLFVTSTSHIGPKAFPPTWHSPALLRLRQGETLFDTNIQMRLTAVHSISGRLIPPAGDEAKMYSVRLIPRNASLSLLGIVNPSVQLRTSTGEFTGASIPAGD